MPSVPLSQSRSAKSVVCVDLDGTLIAADLLWESWIRLFKLRPWAALSAIATLRGGRAAFKARVAAAAPIAPGTLPYREELLSELQALHEAGAYLVLATASDVEYARAVADHLGIFTDVLASDGRTNLSGRRKAEALVARYGWHKFHYIGNAWSDVAVWRAAGEATVIGARRRLVQYVVKERLASRVLLPLSGSVGPIVRALRPHQWVKNLLVFVPLIAAHKALSAFAVSRALLTFAAFTFVASAVYIVNDLCDLDADRKHPRKRFRPFASGELSVPAGVTLGAGLLIAGFMIALTATPPVALVLLVYFGGTVAYSLALKRQPVVDVFALTGLYVLRILAGGVATDTALSSWLLGFALFVFLSLAFAKRHAELMAVRDWLVGRGYGPGDAVWIQAIGTSTGYMAVLVLALYVNSPEVTALYTRPYVLWCLCPMLLFWITRLWFRANRGLIDDDPVVEALRDRVSYVILAAAIGVMLVAI